MSKLGIVLLREWQLHNHPHNCCFEEGPDAGSAICPSHYPNLRGWLAANGYPVDSLHDGKFFGASLDDVSYRVNTSRTYRVPSVDEAMSEGLEGDYRAALEDEDAPVEDEKSVEEAIFQYMSDNFNAQGGALIAIARSQERIETLLSDILASVNALEEKVSERSEEAVVNAPVFGEVATDEALLNILKVLRRPGR